MENSTKVCLGIFCLGLICLMAASAIPVPNAPKLVCDHVEKCV